MNRRNALISAAAVTLGAALPSVAAATTLTSAADPGEVMPGLPKGIIFPFFSTDGMIPIGWALCDGNNGTPNLNGQFLRGSTNHAQVGATGGTTNHQHGVTKHRDKPDGSGPEGEGPHCYITDTTLSDHIPPFTYVLYIMKL